MVQEEHREAHFSAQYSSTIQASRLSSPDVDPRRPSRVAVSPSQGSPQVVSLIWRIRDRRTFLELRRSGRRVRSGVLTVTFAPNAPDCADPPAVAFAVARKVGPAVKRNHIRRRIRSAMREIQADSPPIVPSGAYLISVRSEATTRTYDELSNDLRRALKKLGHSTRTDASENQS